MKIQNQAKHKVGNIFNLILTALLEQQKHTKIETFQDLTNLTTNYTSDPFNN